MFTPSRSLAVNLAHLIVAFTFSSLTYADGLGDLQQALKTFDQRSPFNAQVKASLQNGPQEAKKKNATGHTEFTLKQGQSGLRITYPLELLELIEKETQLKKQNPQAETPTTNAMNRFKYAEFSILFNPVRDIEDDLAKAHLVKEETTDYQGKPARLLHMQIPLEKLSEEERKNLKKYHTDLKIWINEKGVPLASRASGTGSGRFALVIGFEFRFDVEKSYITHGNRLLVSQLNSTSNSKGAGMDEGEHIAANLKLLD